jgi:hypothetical protein
VFSQRTQREAALSESAADMLSCFEALLRTLGAPLLRGISHSSASGGAAEAAAAFGRTDSAGSSSSLDSAGSAASFGTAPSAALEISELASVRSLLDGFDERWVSYLELFVAWKSADAGEDRCLGVCLVLAWHCLVQPNTHFSRPLPEPNPDQPIPSSPTLRIQTLLTLMTLTPATAAGLEAELLRCAVEMEASRSARAAPDGSSRSRSARRRSPEDVAALVEQARIPAF